MNRQSATVFLFATVFVDMLGYGLVVPLLPFYAGGLANGALLVGTLGSLYAVMQFFGAPLLAGLSDRTGRRPVLVVCLLGASLAYALLGRAQTLALVVAAVALAGAAGGPQATAQAFIADSTPPEGRAGVLGLIGAAFGLGLMSGPLLGGFLSLHSLQAPALAASGLALANAAFGFFVLPESLPQDSRHRTPFLRLDPFSGLLATIRRGDHAPPPLRRFVPQPRPRRADPDGALPRGRRRFDLGVDALPGGGGARGRGGSRHTGPHGAPLAASPGGAAGQAHGRRAGRAQPGPDLRPARGRSRLRQARSPGTLLYRGDPLCPCPAGCDFVLAGGAHRARTGDGYRSARTHRGHGEGVTEKGVSS